MQSLNVVIVNGNTKPLIEINKTDIELMTKTKVRQESDDNSFSLSPIVTETYISKAFDDRKNTLLNYQKPLWHKSGMTSAEIT